MIKVDQKIVLYESDCDSTLTDTVLFNYKGEHIKDGYLYVTDKFGKAKVPCQTCFAINYNPVGVEVHSPKGKRFQLFEIDDIIHALDHFVGDPQPDLFIVGEAPGYHEYTKKRPFIGEAGKLLRDVITKTDASVCLGNAVQCRPIKSDAEVGGVYINRTPTPKEYENCGILIKHTVKYVQPKSLLLLGRTAFNLFLPGKEAVSLGSARQLKNNEPNWHWLNIPTFVSWHPSYVMRKGGTGTPTYYEFVSDLARAIRG